MKRDYQVCTQCVMDTTDADITFNNDGVCSHCVEFAGIQRGYIYSDPSQQELLHDRVATIKSRGRGRKYDCIIGLSGGIDSSYVALRVVELGLRPLAVHVDTGWNSELAVSNIEQLVKRLGIDLYTKVIDWDVMRDLQLAFFRSGVPNCDIPQDHAFVAVLYRTAVSHQIRDVVSGHNLATEAILPDAWGYTSIDRHHIRAIHSKFGRGSLRRYPSYSLLQYAFIWPYVRRMKIFPILNYMSYRKADAKTQLIEEFGWKDYGGKHYESRLTKFFQSYYLPVKFGFDKRRAHFSSLIVTNQMSREAALKELELPPYNPETADSEKAFIAKKLRISDAEFSSVISGPCHEHSEYPSRATLIATLLQTKTRIANLFQ